MAHEAPSTETFIDETMSRSNCKKHKADVDEPCYRIEHLRGVCNARAKRAGYDHTISDSSKGPSSGETRRNSR